MNVSMIKMRRHGVELSRAERSREYPYNGTLNIMDRLDQQLYRNVKIATLTGKSGFAHMLLEPRIIWANDGRFMLTGFERVEMDGKLVEFAQSWLCGLRGEEDGEEGHQERGRSPGGRR